MRSSGAWLSLLAGFSIMASELAAGRLLAPYFGTSTPVWATVIGSVLGALTLGAMLGGRLAGSKRGTKHAFALLLAAGAMLFLVPLCARPLMRDALSWFVTGHIFRVLAALSAVLLMLFLPLVALGALGPVLTGNTVRRADEAARVAARFGAAGTIGSLLGTFVSGIVLVPLFGTEFVFRICGALTVVVGIWGLVLGASKKELLLRRWVVAIGAVFATLMVVCPNSATFSSASVAELETSQNYLRVVDEGDKRKLYINDGYATQTVAYTDGRPYLQGIWGYYGAAMGLPRTKPKRILILGLGGGASASYFARRLEDVEIVAVESDAGVALMAKQYFALPDRVQVHVDDARRFLAADTHQYDLVLIDAFQFPYIPFQLTTQQFFEIVQQHMSPGAALLMNVGRKGGELDVVHAVASTLQTTFPHVSGVSPSGTTNTLLVATSHPLSASVGLSFASLPDEERRVFESLSPMRPWSVPAASRRVLIDDCAPVEWLTNMIVLREIWKEMRG